MHPKSFFPVLLLTLLASVLAFPTANAAAAATGRFVATDALATPRQHPGAALLPNGSVLVVGGDNATISGTFLSSAEIYDPRGGLFSPTGSLVTQMFDPLAVTMPNGKVLVTDDETANVYDPSSGTFSSTTAPNLRNAVSCGQCVAAIVLKTGKVLLTDGTSAELYDPSSGSITPTGSLLQSRSAYAATLLGNGKVLIAGGTEAELYDPSSGTFSATGSLTHTRNGPLLGALIGGSSAQTGGFLVVGGADQNGNATPGADLYNPSSGQFTFINSAEFPDRLLGATATTLKDGRVLIAGGIDQFNDYDLSTSIYDPSTGTFTATPFMVHFRANHSATLLSNGKVLIAGGGVGILSNSSGTNEVSCCNPIGSSDLFDPAYSGFVSAVSLAYPPYQVFPPLQSVGVMAVTKPDVQWVNFYLDGKFLQSSPPFEFNLDSSTLTDGPHTLMAIAFTSSPSRANLGSDSVVINVANHHVQIVNIASGSPSSGCQPLVVQPDSSVSWVDNYLDGVYQNSSLSSCIDTTKVANGIHTIATTAFASNGTVVGKDSVLIHSANAATHDHAFIVGPPSASGASATIPIGAGLESGVQWVNIYVDGNFLASSPPLALNLDTGKLSNGNHTVSLKGFNSSGQVATDQITISVLN